MIVRGGGDPAGAAARRSIFGPSSRARAIAAIALGGRDQFGQPLQQLFGSVLVGRTAVTPARMVSEYCLPLVLEQRGCDGLPDALHGRRRPYRVRYRRRTAGTDVRCSERRDRTRCPG